MKKGGSGRWRRGRSAAACLLAAALTACALAGCQGQKAALAGTEASHDTTETNGGQESTETAAEKTGQPAGEWELEAQEPEPAVLEVDNYDGWNALLGENKISEEFQKGLERFAFQSGSAVLKDAAGNGNYSPLSLYYALALAGCGAEEETASQILNNLGVEDRQELADQCGKLYQWYVYKAQREREQMEEYGGGDYKSTIELGNSLWASHRLRMKTDYQELAARQFFASSYGVDFSDPETGKKMGAWIGQKTHGVLEPRLEPDPETALAILNTLYFYGGWITPFQEEDTEPGVFTKKDGSRMEVSYMNRTEAMGSFYRGDGYTLSYLPTDNNCRMLFLLPDEGRSVEEFLETPEKLEAVMKVDEAAWTTGEVTWKVPKFDFGSSYKLEKMLAAMGMERMFGDQAEFGVISPDPLYVSSVIQETHIGVDEQGVEGAAYTMMAMGMGALSSDGSAEMILDRPFLFGIQDKWNDVWLFLGVCQEPESAGEPALTETTGEENGAETAAEEGVSTAAAKPDLLLTTAPELHLKDLLSSRIDDFTVKPGSYSWNWREDGRMRGTIACGSDPLDLNLEHMETLEIPHYNGQEEVSYGVSCVILPRQLTVREWDADQLDKIEPTQAEEMVYVDTEGSGFILPLKPDKVYEILADWLEEDFERNGFYGQASYVIVTE